MRVLFVALTVVLAGKVAGQPQVERSTLFDGLDLGSHQVGFRLQVATDRTRPSLPNSSSAEGRVVPIAIWYPANASPTRNRMRVADYVRASSRAIAGLDDSSAAAAFEQRYPATNRPQLEKTSMLAAEDVPAAAGKFPLILFAHAAPDSQSVMAEYLATHGFVVAAVRSRGAQDLAYRLSRENLDAMTTDLIFAWTQLQSAANVRPGLAGFIGMSNGAIGATAVQFKQRIVGGIVSLDGGIGEDAGGTYLRERANQDPRAIRAPLLHLYTEPNQYLNLSHIRSYEASDRTLIRIAGLRHADFLNDAVFNVLLNDDPTNRAAAEGYRWVAQYTLRFLQSALSDTPRSPDWLGSEKTPSGRVTIERLPIVPAGRRP